MNRKLFVISGSSGVGKGTVLKRFMEKNPEFILSISCTTRSQREGETDGINYFFISKEEFRKCIDEEKFLEWAEFADNFYGTKKKYINECLSSGKNVILEIDTKGAMQVKRQMPDAVLIFISPPSYEALEKRLRGRHTEDETAVQKRLEQVKLELDTAKYFDYEIINDNLNTAVNALEEIILKEIKIC